MLIILWQHIWNWQWRPGEGERSGREAGEDGEGPKQKQEMRAGDEKEQATVARPAPVPDHKASVAAKVGEERHVRYEGMERGEPGFEAVGEPVGKAGRVGECSAWLCLCLG